MAAARGFPPTSIPQPRAKCVLTFYKLAAPSLEYRGRERGEKRWRAAAHARTRRDLEISNRAMSKRMSFVWLRAAWACAWACLTCSAASLLKLVDPARQATCSIRRGGGHRCQLQWRRHHTSLLGGHVWRSEGNVSERQRASAPGSACLSIRPGRGEGAQHVAREQFAEETTPQAAFCAARRL